MIASPAGVAPRLHPGVALRARFLITTYWPIAAVLAAFWATAFVVPTLTPVATTDDWGYSRSVEILLDEHRLTVFPVVAATAVFQIGWGAAFALVFGMSLGIMRVSTLVMVSLSAIALYALLRELGVSRGRSALGVATYLFNPLSFVLAYTFMTDPFLTALVVISTYGYVRGLRRDAVDPHFVLVGAVAATCAFLTRQQGILIPVAILMNLAVTRRLWFNRESVKLVAMVSVVPLAGMAAYYAWLTYFNDIPSVQESFTREIRRAGIEGSWRLGRNLAFIILMYLGFFALPLTLAAIPGLPRVVRAFRWRAAAALVPWVTVLALGLYLYGQLGKRWPYIPQFVGSGGLGPPDVLGSRPRVFVGDFFTWVTLVCAISAVLVAIFVCAGAGARPSRERSAAGVVLAVTAWQAIGIIPPSFHYIRRGYSLDRYLLPLLPLVICLLLCAIREYRLFQPVGWALVAVMIAFGVAGTRDYLTYLDTVWEIAEEAHAAGVPRTQIDAGAAWDGYHLYTYALDNNITRAQTRGGPWWMTFYGLASDSTFVVSSRPRDGYAVVWQRSYDSWLLGEETPMYLLRRIGPSPP